MKNKAISAFSRQPLAGDGYFKASGFVAVSLRACTCALESQRRKNDCQDAPVKKVKPGNH